MKMSSRERMLKAINCQTDDHPPCCFMQFTALEKQCRDQIELVKRQLAMGCDAVVQSPPWLLTIPGDTVDLRGLPVNFHPQVRIKEWEKESEVSRYPLLCKEYATPEGALNVVINKTGDYPYQNHIPFMDDFIIPRSQKMPVAEMKDLKGLRYLLAPPSKETIEEFKSSGRPLRQFARDNELLITGGAGVGADAAGWLCGLQNLIYYSIEQPDFTAELMSLIAAWNLSRMEVVLKEGLDLWVRRGWYENCDFWSPATYRQFIFPHLKDEAALAHSYGAKFGYIITSHYLPLVDMILEAGVDVLIGFDPVMGGVDAQALLNKIQGKICLWGGVNSPLMVEDGEPAEVRKAVREALDALAPSRGLILSPVDDVEYLTDNTWANVDAFIESWKDWCRA